MIPALGAISVDGAGFALLAAALIALAWSRWRGLFPGALLAASMVMAASWLKPADALGLLAFIGPPWFVIRWLWGRKERAAGPAIPLLVAWQVALFVVLRGYDGLAALSWLDQPVAVIGLSYMLFRIVHLAVDAPLMARWPLSPARYLAYVLALWTLISGPIQRYDDFCRGLSGIGRPEPEAAMAAAHRVVNGLLKAFVLAPVFLPASDIRLLAAPGAGWLDFAVVFYAYPAYLYLNFSGYTDVVIGVARLCGFATLPENFNRPYLARNIQDFWGRWHISFGVWIRSYLFTPMLKALLTRLPGRDGALTALAVVATFAVVGVWHGSGANFLLFGLLHGAGVLAAAGWGAFLKARLGKAGRKAFDNRPWVRATATALCFHYVCATLALVPNGVGDLAAALSAFFG